MKSISIIQDDLLINTIIDILQKDDRVQFAYLYGSIEKDQKGNDIDIAVYAKEPVDAHRLSADLKIDLHKSLGFSPDVFDIRIINDLADQSDIYSLLYLKNVLTGSRILVDKDPDIRADFLEQYGFRFRECEGLMEEI